VAADQDLERGLVALGQEALQELRVGQDVGVAQEGGPAQVPEDAVAWTGRHVTPSVGRGRRPSSYRANGGRCAGFSGKSATGRPFGVGRGQRSRAMGKGGHALFLIFTMPIK